jgi:serine/threonine protein kinase
MAAFGVPVRDHEIQQWIRDSDKNWTRKLGKGWVGKRFLGKGQFGIVGLWEYQGPPQMAPEITQVVVKQVCLDMAHIEPPWGEMTGLSEGTILQKLSKVNTRHIIKMYGGNKLGDRFGEMSVVVKMFLEFCPGGDLEQLLVGWDEDYAPMRRKHVYDESDIWTIFYCLALGIAAMDRGTENSMEPAWFGEGERPLPPDQQTEICHFDIKPDNSKTRFPLYQPSCTS